MPTMPSAPGLGSTAWRHSCASSASLGSGVSELKAVRVARLLLFLYTLRRGHSLLVDVVTAGHRCLHRMRDPGVRWLARGSPPGTRGLELPSGSCEEGSAVFSHPLKPQLGEEEMFLFCRGAVCTDSVCCVPAGGALSGHPAILASSEAWGRPEELGARWSCGRIGHC